MPVSSTRDLTAIEDGSGGLLGTMAPLLDGRSRSNLRGRVVRVGSVFVFVDVLLVREAWLCGLGLSERNR